VGVKWLYFGGGNKAIRGASFLRREECNPLQRKEGCSLKKMGEKTEGGEKILVEGRQGKCGEEEACYTKARGALGRTAGEKSSRAARSSEVESIRPRLGGKEAFPG